MEFLQFRHEAGVEVEEVGILLDEGHGGHFFLDVVVLADTGVVYKGTYF